MNNDNCCEDAVEQRNCCNNTNTCCSNNDNSNSFNNTSTRQEMLMQIKEYDFALDELNLYLDTHPDDSQALCLQNNYANALRNLERQYQRVYGPLTANCPCNKWRWIEEPWPWERGIM